MAYTAAPELSTYGSKRLPAAYNIALRPNAAIEYSSSLGIEQDAGMINLVPLKEGDQITAYTRPSLVGGIVDSGRTNSAPRGIYCWIKDSSTPLLFVVMGSRVYVSSDNGVSWTQRQTLSTSNIRVAFTEFITSTATKYLCIADGSNNIYVFTGDAAPTTVSIGFTSIPSLVYLDGYLFTADADTGDIYNSNLDDPFTWTAGDFISSELYPDDIKALVKVNNYLLAVGTAGSEFFYDAANPTGTPLARYQDGALPFGTSYPNSIAATKNQVVMLTKNNDGEVVLRAIENFKFSDIPADFLVGIISAKAGDSNSDDIDKDRLCGYFVRLRGNPIYVINTRPYFTPTSDRIANWKSTPTVAYDFKSGMWFEMRMTRGALSYPFTAAVASDSGRNEVTTYVSGWCWESGSTTMHTYWATFNESNSVDATDTLGAIWSETINTTIRTPILDFDTLNRKFMSRFGCIATTAVGGATATVSVSWSDDNYTNYSTAKTLTLTDTTKFPFITRLGEFRQRSFKITSSGTARIRYKGFEVDINKGQQ